MVALKNLVIHRTMNQFITSKYYFKISFIRNTWFYYQIGFKNNILYLSFENITFWYKKIMVAIILGNFNSVV